jgi:hypothetical protein
MSHLPDVQQLVESALSAAGEFTTGWVIAYERVNDDGERVLVHECSEDLADWVRIGMLYTAIEMGPYIIELTMGDGDEEE